MINNPADLTDLLANIAAIEHHEHSRCRVYPQDVEEMITLAAALAANTFGSWTQIIPIDIVDFCFEKVGLVIEAADKATTYFIQLGYSIVDGSDPTTAQIMGERRILLPSPVNKAMELLAFYSQNCPAKAKLWGRIKTASATADELKVSVVVIRHMEITNPIPQLETWPWST